MASRSAGAQLFDDVGQIGGMQLPQLVVRNAEPQAALRIGLDDIAKFPADRIGRDGLLQAANPARRHYALDQAAEDAAYADVHFQDGHDVAPAVVADLERNVIDTDDFAPVHVDDLLIQQIALDAQHVLVGMIGREVLVGEVNAVERNGGNLVEADAQPGPAAAHQEAVDAGGMNQGNERGIANPADAAVLQVIDRQAHQLGIEEKVSAIENVRAQNVSAERNTGIFDDPAANCNALYMAISDASL